ncbi:unnamed protein product [Adineta steineri]|uniref:C2H2-type domain-containing protein n=1 Tax=Adineta steineri TaxID=433720 RepID=A0A819BL73_9BILA|nr:unnamed protein product [Adineta steineri]CAF1225546.1 unnamed protein product [Adineta steineri]CAF3803558.1 unnamed protein product [Adineta steineri]CAF3860219.1 unnamed protein product [Adineta steineri]
MTDNSSAPIDLRIKRKRVDVNDDKLSTKKKSRNHHDSEIPLDLSVKSQQQSSQYSLSTPTVPLYNPTNLFFNSSALFYDLFLANLNVYCQQQQQQQHQQPLKVEPSKSTKQQSAILPSRLIRDNSTTNKHESYACSCGERYSNVAQLVSHLKITNHSAQLSSTHDEVAKLVRGQDIWLSRDTNPANQILKCLRCSLSFETLPDLTAHMMKTNHFTQFSPSPSSSSSNSYQHSSLKQQQQQQQQQQSPTKLSSRSTCLVCSQQFAREVDLVDHLQRLHQIRFNCTTCGMYFENESLYKEHLLKEMHHRNGKTNKNRDYFINQCSKVSQKRLITEIKSERPKFRSSIDKDVERVTSDLLDRIASKDETTNGNALSLLQNFVIKQTPTTTLLNTLNRRTQIDLNNNCDDENNDQNMTNLSLLNQTKSNENPLASLEKMLACSTASTELPSSSINENGTKKKKFDKYRLFAEKMLRSTLS